MSNGTPKPPAETDYLVGRHPVMEALDENRSVDRILVQKSIRGPWVDALRRKARMVGVPLQYVPRQRLDRLAPGANHQGVAAFVAPIRYRVLEELLNEIARDTDVVRERKPVLLLLDGLEDPRNFGAVLRSALAAGVDGVIVPEGGMAPLGATVVKASAGAALRLPVARCSRLTEAIDQLKERGYWVIGTDGQAEENHWEFDWTRPTALVIGGEGSGIRAAVRERCDAMVAIPIFGDIESLNASVATAVVLFEIRRSRREPGASR